MRCEVEVPQGVRCHAEADARCVIESVPSAVSDEVIPETVVRLNACLAHQAFSYSLGGWRVRQRNWYPRQKNCCPSDACQHNLIGHTEDGCQSPGCGCQMKGGILRGSANGQLMFEALQALRKNDGP